MTKEKTAGRPAVEFKGGNAAMPPLFQSVLIFVAAQHLFAVQPRQ
jgi:hypothetical protein